MCVANIISLASLHLYMTCEIINYVVIFYTRHITVTHKTFGYIIYISSMNYIGNKMITIRLIYCMTG